MIATFNIFGRKHRIPPKYAVAAMVIGIPTALFVFGYLTYLVLETVDHYLGTTKVGAAVLLTIVLGRFTTHDSVYGDKVIALLPEWANHLVLNILPVVTAWFLYQQERQYDCIFVLSVLAVSATTKFVTWMRATRARAKEQERKWMRGLARQYSEPKDVPFKEDKE